MKYDISLNKSLNKALEDLLDYELEYLLQDPVSQMRYDNLSIVIENEIKRREMVEVRNKKLEDLGI